MSAHRPDDHGRARWRLPAQVLAAVLAWPSAGARSLWRGRQFRQVSRKAAGHRFRIVAEGLWVQGSAPDPRRVGWDELGAGLWWVRRQPSLASGDEDRYAVDLPRHGLALDDGEGHLALVLLALRERGIHPPLHDAGRALGAAGWLAAMAWLAALVAAVVVAGVVASN